MKSNAMIYLSALFLASGTIAKSDGVVPDQTCFISNKSVFRIVGSDMYSHTLSSSRSEDSEYWSHLSLGHQPDLNFGKSTFALFKAKEQLLTWSQDIGGKGGLEVLDLNTLEMKNNGLFNKIDNNAFKSSDVISNAMDIIPDTSTLYSLITLNSTNGLSSKLVYGTLNSDANDQSLKSTSSQPTFLPRKGYTFTYVGNGQLLLLGGQSLSKNNELISFSNIMIYDAIKQEWLTKTTSGDLPESRTSHQVQVIDNTVYLIGGITSDGNPVKTEVGALSLSTLEWKILKLNSPLTEAQAKQSLCQIISGGKLINLGIATGKEIDLETGSLVTQMLGLHYNLVREDQLNPDGNLTPGIPSMPNRIFIAIGCSVGISTVATIILFSLVMLGRAMESWMLNLKFRSALASNMDIGSDSSETSSQFSWKPMTKKMNMDVKFN